MVTTSVENMLVTSIGTTLETGVVTMQYIVLLVYSTNWYPALDRRRSDC